MQAVRRINNQVRHDLFLSLLQKDQRQYHSQDTGEYMAWLTNHLKQMEKLAWEPFFDMVGRIAQIIFSIIGLAILHWSMLAASLVISVIMWAVPRLFGRKLEKLSDENAQAYAAGVSQLKDLLAGFDTLRTFGKTRRLLENGDRVSDDMEAPNSRMVYRKDAVDCIIGVISITMQILTDVLIVILVLNQKIGIAVFAGGSNLTGGVSNGLMNFASLRMSILASRPYFEKITVHAGEADRDRADKCLWIESGIVMQNVSFSYGERPVLQNASFRFEKGGKYALIGPSGCGKTTVLKLLLGWLPDYDGAIRFDGKDAREISAESLLPQIGYIEQDVFLFHSTIRENITLGDDFTDAQMNKALRESALEGDLPSFENGLDTIVGENGSNLSGGQKQRVAIARALIYNRSILLVDEGTSALDQRNADIVEESLLANPELTLILVSHHLSEERKAKFDQVYDLGSKTVQA